MGFVAQNTPVYSSFTVAEHLKLGAKMNPAWDPALAERRIRQVGLNSAQKAGQLSGGQRAQLALTIAAAKRPELLIFDEPAAALDPLARKGFLQNLMEFVARTRRQRRALLAPARDIEQVCDYLIVLCDGRVQVAGDTVETCWPTARPAGRAPRRARPVAAGVEVISMEHSGQRSTRSCVPRTARRRCRTRSSPSRSKNSSSPT